MYRVESTGREKGVMVHHGKMVNPLLVGSGMMIFEHAARVVAFVMACLMRHLPGCIRPVNILSGRNLDTSFTSKSQRLLLQIR